MKIALEDRGWFENKDYRSPCFDLKWTCKSTDAYSTALNETQVSRGEWLSWGVGSGLGICVILGYEFI